MVGQASETVSKPAFRAGDDLGGVGVPRERGMNRPKSGRFSKRPYDEDILTEYFETVSDACPTDLCPGLAQRLAGFPRQE